MLDLVSHRDYRNRTHNPYCPNHIGHRKCMLTCRSDHSLQILNNSFLKIPQSARLPTKPNQQNIHRRFATAQRTESLP